ncbi:zinc finger protein CONSTANS-LIKE 16 isoform X2 [Cajanus cajan]|uniref:zinc finger protein CONSTANS-LIKE 16 isoform X2 n=1 Tax=Cajanus cajan TaxID=3821 RepID=UPI0010FAE079|nr:zinc finger protein CONSTANS-LIKE 16 isoform X2 [Cajanus cajan]
MSSSAKNAANAVGGKTARACDSCITKRARWYCAADDAFLCQACDSSVHSANPLARRHERVRLKTASFKSGDEQQPPTWHTKKARTPRHGKHSPVSRNSNINPFYLVPEVGSEEVNSQDENEEQLLYRVPIFDPLVAELCGTNSSASSATSTDEGGVAAAAAAAAAAAEVEKKGVESNVFCHNNEMENLHGLLPSDAELAEFAADVESLLGRGLENECVGMEVLGLVDAKEECWVKVEEEEEEEEEEHGAVEMEMEMVGGRDESFELSFDYEMCEEVNEKEDEEEKRKKKKISLQLDYEGVIIAWPSQKSPWTTAHRPNLDPDQCWHECMGGCGTAVDNPYGEMGMGGFGIHPVIMDGGREARVSRYREKRRTRLFSKKIRYEVRKLNAEKRPRMKGRFVKRASFAPPTFPLLNK